MGLPPLYKYTPTVEPPDWPTRKAGMFKPVGLWLSVEDAWEEWCHREQFGLDRVAWRHPVTVLDHARVLMLDNLSTEFDEFHNQYTRDSDRSGVPAWDRVARDWDVLMLYPWTRPPLGELAKRYRWDSSWDCPSAVVLSPGMITYGVAEHRCRGSCSCEVR